MLPWLTEALKDVHLIFSAQQKYCSALEGPVGTLYYVAENQEDLACSSSPAPTVSCWAQGKPDGDTGNFLRGVQTSSGVQKVNMIYNGIFQ